MRIIRFDQMKQTNNLLLVEITNEPANNPMRLNLFKRTKSNYKNTCLKVV